MPKKQLKGIIISDKMQKTVVVEVENIKEHPKYKRRFKTHKKYKAHDEGNIYKTGDVVMIEECRPISKDKKWRVISKLAESKIISEEGIEETDLIREISEKSEEKENN
ncbi:MAG: 30S ribosomal protein S17 [Candidatus Parcubacteria bacterium]|nr:30S ribosomal protein S17 [Candidatus Parcubacteria bacterium]